MPALKGTLEDEEPQAEDKIPKIKEVRSPIEVKKGSKAHEPDFLEVKNDVAHSEAEA